MNEILGYKFKNKQLLKESLTHPSSCLKDKSVVSYERLEFLGDSVLSLVIIEHLLTKFPSEAEGKLAKRKSALVNGETLAKIGFSINLGASIIMSKSEQRLGGRENPHNVENTLEALIGAIYLDSGLETIKDIINKLWTPYIDSMKTVPIDPKSKLQENLQKRGIALPKYELVEQDGPDHMLTFKVKLYVIGHEEVIGIGKSKQLAEKAAALLLLEQLHKKA